MKLKFETTETGSWRTLCPGEPNGIAPYLASPGLIEAVELALLLGRPLLLQGEPGCGKTQLAKAVAWNLYGANYPAHFREWPVNSTSKARDGRYQYDHIQRLRDAQLAAAGLDQERVQKRFSDPMAYIQKGVLWESFEAEVPMVLLIDEIDKADIDFPNDLLMEMDQHYFYVDELATEAGKYKVEVKDKANTPLIIITSNQERPLPDAFLRRCIYYYIDFPDAEQLKAIVLRHFERDAAGMEEGLLNRAIEEFGKMRQIIAADRRDGGKNITTSELLDWCKVLREYAKHPQYKDVIQNRLAEIPFASVLLKHWEDHQRYLRKTQV